MMHRIVFLLLALLITMPVLAVPADPTPFEITLSDGSKIMVRQVGDESYSYLITEDGVPVVKGADGLYRLAPGQEELHRSRFKTRFAERNNELMSNMQQTLSRKMASARSGGTLRKATPFDLADKTYKSTKIAMVVLVQFPDLRFKHDFFEFHDMLNKEGYSDHNMAGSVHDYFYDNSYKQFDLQFVVEGPIMMDHEYAYYGQNGDDGKDLNVGEMVIELSNKLQKNYVLLTGQYDWDNNGDIDQLIVIYAGKGEASAGGDADKENYIWPHKWYLTNWFRKYRPEQKTLPEIGGKKVNKYLVTCELSGTGAFNGIGTFCHEFCHCLGLPDLYDTDYADNGYLGFGMNAWDLMASGSYGGPDYIGECPTGLSLLERYFLGWEDPGAFGSAFDVKNMPAFGDKPREGSYMIRQEDDDNEFVILENRQPTKSKWFRYVGTNPDVHGLLVYRCYYDPTVWTKNEVNIGTSQYVTVIPCGKTFGTKGTKGYYLTRDEYQSQLFPNIDCNALTPSSHIGFNGRWAHTELPFAWAIKDIVEDDNGLISFSYTSHYNPDPWWDKDDNPITGSSDAKLRYWVDDESEPQIVAYASALRVDLKDYDEGFHTLYMQLVNKDGYGSDVVTTPFYKLPAYQAMKYNVWFDNDPSTQRVVENEENKSVFLFETDQLTEGFHTIHIQAYNGEFLSEVKEAFFYRKPDVSLTGKDLRVHAMIDGVHSNQGLIYADGRLAEMDFYACDLDDGFHVLQLYVQNKSGKTSDIYETYFIKAMDAFRDQYLVVDYSIDGQQMPFMYPDLKKGQKELNILLPLEGIPDGKHVIDYVIASQDGKYQKMGTAIFLKGKGLMGDMNADDKITKEDVQEIVDRYVKDNVDVDVVWYGDMNGDGKITVVDITAIIRESKKTQQ